MKLLRIALVGVLVFGVTALRAADVKEKEVDKDKLVGVWEATDKSQTIPPGSTLEFTKDGKIKMVIKVKDKTENIGGTYKIEGDSLKVTLKAEKEEHTETIKVKTLTDKELVTVDEKKKEDTFKKQEAKKDK
jgi:uncharacterized protein (TIGR03066 family)